MELFLKFAAFKRNSQTFIYIRKFFLKAKQKKMFVCENPGGQKNIHQAGRESIFLPNFQTILTN